MAVPLRLPDDAVLGPALSEVVRELGKGGEVRVDEAWLRRHRGAAYAEFRAALQALILRDLGECKSGAFALTFAREVLACVEISLEDVERSILFRGTGA